MKSRHKLDDPSVQRYFIVLYQGLKNDKFYWELVNTLRKVLIVCSNVFLAQYPLFYKGVLAVVMIILFYRLQLFLSPFKDKENNEVENTSYLASCITLYSGLLFINEEERGNDVIDLIAFFLILIFNIKFFLLWAYLMSKTFNKYEIVKKITNFLRIILCKRKEVKGKSFYLPLQCSTQAMNLITILI